MKEISKLIFLAQTDTTVGFLGKNQRILNAVKCRALDQNLILEVDSLSTLKDLTRIPQAFKNQIRRSLKATFIYPNCRSFRLVGDFHHKLFLDGFKDLFSTSANPSGLGFDFEWARDRCDVMVLDSRGLSEKKASRIYKLSKSRIKRIR